MTALSKHVSGPQTRAALAMLLAFCADACSGPPGLADGGPRTDTSTPGADSGPIALERLPDGVWSFVRVPGAVCGNGSPAGIGVNPHAGARDLLIVIAGGGACWDADTCFGRHTATHIDEDYTQAMFDAERSTISDAGWDDRAALVNPFREANIVYVPYCTGDIHAGDTVQADFGVLGNVAVQFV